MDEIVIKEQATIERATKFAETTGESLEETIAMAVHQRLFRLTDPTDFLYDLETGLPR